jgi:hypothetical protein
VPLTTTTRSTRRRPLSSAAPTAIPCLAWGQLYASIKMAASLKPMHPMLVVRDEQGGTAKPHSTGGHLPLKTTGQHLIPFWDDLETGPSNESVLALRANQATCALKSFLFISRGAIERTVENMRGSPRPAVTSFTMLAPAATAAAATCALDVSTETTLPFSAATLLQVGHQLLFGVPIH